MFHYVSLCFTMFHYVSLCFTMFHYVSLSSFGYFQTISDYRLITTVGLLGSSENLGETFIRFQWMIIKLKLENLEKYVESK